MYWACDCPIKQNGGKLNQTWGYTEDELRVLCTRQTRGSKNWVGRSRQLGFVELLASQSDWNVWASRRTYTWFSFERVWAKKGVWISYINYDSDMRFKIMPIYEGGADFQAGKAEVKAKWEKIRATAESYEWAEQEGFDADRAAPKFENWPRSLYRPFGSNSNTFVRYAIGEAGLTMVEMANSHPGGDPPPTQNTEWAHAGGRWSFFPNHTPWWTDANAKPKPIKPPPQ